MSGPPPFELSSVVHLVRPAGYRAHDLEAFRQGVDRASPSTLFLHTVQCQLRLPTATLMPPDDFSSWINGVVQDRETAERVSFAVQYRGATPAELRAALLDLLGEMPEKRRRERAAPPEGDFVFLEVESVPVGTAVRLTRCEDLLPALAEAEPAVWFYHLIEQPWLHPHTPALLDWVRGCGDVRSLRWLEELTSSGHTLEEMRRRLSRRWKQNRLGQRVAEAALNTEEERREAGRAAVADLVRRITGGGERP